MHFEIWLWVIKKTLVNNLKINKIGLKIGLLKNYVIHLFQNNKTLKTWVNELIKLVKHELKLGAQGKGVKLGVHHRNSGNLKTRVLKLCQSLEESKNVCIFSKRIVHIISIIMKNVIKIELII